MQPYFNEFPRFIAWCARRSDFQLELNPGVLGLLGPNGAGNHSLIEFFG